MNPFHILLQYLNGGPGCVGGHFVHEKHAHNFKLPRYSILKERRLSMIDGNKFNNYCYVLTLQENYI